MNSDATGLILFVSFFLLLGLLGYLVYRRMSRHVAAIQDKREQQTEALGFTSVEDPAFAARLAAHFQADEQQRPYIRGLKRKAGDAGTLWLCHIQWRGDDVWPAAVVVESAQLALPRFLLLPEKPQSVESARGFDVNRHLHHLWAVDDSTRDFPPMRLEGTRHMLSGPKAGWTETIFTPVFRSWLHETDGLAMSGEGSLLVIWPDYPSAIGWGPPLEDDVAINVRRAEACAAHLRRQD